MRTVVFEKDEGEYPGKGKMSLGNTIKQKRRLVSMECVKMGLGFRR